MPKMSAAKRREMQVELDALQAEKAAAEADQDVVDEWVDADGVRVLEFADGTRQEGGQLADSGEDPGPVLPVAGLELAPGFEIEMVPVDKLQEHPKNANRGDLDAIGASQDKSGFYGVVVAQRSTGYILAGNHRYRSAVRKGLGEVPTNWVDVDAIGAIRILLADNETARRGTMDLGAQDALIQELKEVDPDLQGTGFDKALAELAAAEAEEEAAAEAEEKEREEAEEQEFAARYGVIVMCRDEAHQAEVYERLAELELGELRVVAV